MKNNNNGKNDIDWILVARVGKYSRVTFWTNLYMTYVCGTKLHNIKSTKLPGKYRVAQKSKPVWLIVIKSY